MIEPFDQARLNPNSYNYRLGSTLITVNNFEAEPAAPELIPADGVVLYPRRFYLAHTVEILGSRRYAMTLLGRSSMGRLGLFLNLTADLGHVGTVSQWTLELAVVQPLRVYSGMEVGQIAFWEIDGPIRPYSGKYQADVGPVQNRDPKLGMYSFEDKPYKNL